MKKRIERNQLKIGMRIIELDRPWLESPFLFQDFTITNDEDLAMVQSLCSHVFIDDDPALDTTTVRRPQLATSIKSPSASPHLAISGHGSPQEAPGTEGRSKPIITPRYADSVPVEVELEQVMEIERVARETIFTIFDDIKLGRAINVANARQVVEEVVESAIRNPDALIWITQLKKKHEYTAMHGLRVCMLAVSMGRHLGFDQDKLNVLGTGSMLLDIGKILIPNEILDKPSALNEAEYEIMKSHVAEGVQILQGSQDITPAALEIIELHHEHYDGSGYLKGLSGDSIGELPMITAIVDTYDAMLSNRNFQQANSNVETIQEIYKYRGTHFHPWLTEQFIQCMGIYPVGSVVEMTNGEVGVVIAINRVRRLKPRVTLVRSADGTPINPVKDIDLMFSCDDRRQPYEIKQLLPAGSLDINPVDYMPCKG